MRRGAPAATLTLQPRGPVLTGGFLQAPFFIESPAADHPPHADCALESPPLSDTMTLLGLAGTEIEQDAMKTDYGKPDHFEIPRARLRGSKSFTVTDRSGPDEGCPRSYYSQCSESGSI